jgi:hypothetical protein
MVIHMENIRGKTYVIAAALGADSDESLGLQGLIASLLHGLKPVDAWHFKVSKQSFCMFLSKRIT